MADPRPRPLPLPLAEIPEALRRFVDPAAPGPGRMMAARGLAPAKGGDLLFILAQLAADDTPEIASAASATLDKMPEGVLSTGLDGVTNPSVLDALAERFRGVELLTKISLNPATANGTVAFMAMMADEALSERIALNEARLAVAPSIIEALYRNKNTRMSTADRLIDFAVRNNLELPNLPTYKEHAEALTGQLIPEATEEAMPSDLMFLEAMAADDDDHMAVEVGMSDDDSEGAPVKVEKVKEKHLPLAMKISNMTKAEKVRFAIVGNAAARAILVRDTNRGVAMAAVQSPSMTVEEAIEIAKSRQISEEILRHVGNKKDWGRSYELKKALVFNAKTPLGIALKYVGLLTDADVKALSKSKNVPQAIRSVAVQRVVKKVGGKG